ncbi:hypothetical protein N7452_000419 [Penicillium brevicompactum]|uniref:Zn(2)-C6 fungal-type domain-containing protein n=1 Tax=Penicillium brevicompactum TaxID=5074 RepID=A0A9W9UQ63_PENBR|nr:hypothetical protein N7452_000419 [Penicillium brevicompactum]
MDHAVQEACWTCRSRHVQCDRSKAPCDKCLKAGLECVKKLPFRWVQGVAIRGNMKGHVYENKSGGTLKRPKQFRIKPAVIKAAGQRRKDNKRICTQFVVYDNSNNQLRKLIPFALKDPILGKAIFALAARHLANQGRSFNKAEVFTSPEVIKYDRDALSFKQQVIAGLSVVLGDSKDSNKCHQDMTIASVFLLILLDLLESGGEEWQFHSHGAKSLITSSLHQSPPKHVPSEQEPAHIIHGLRDFVIQQISLVDTLGSIFLHPKSPSQELSINQKEMTQDSIDYSFLACPDLILGKIRSISRIRDVIARTNIPNGTSLQSQVQAISAVLKIIESFDCALWASETRKSTQFHQETHFLAIVAHVYKIAALLYANRVLSALQKQSKPQDELLFELLGLLNGLKDRPELLKCLLWPIFVAGLECQSLEQQNFFLARLEDFWMTTNCLNVISAADILQEYWKREDQENSCWAFDVARFGQAWLLI